MVKNAKGYLDGEPKVILDSIGMLIISIHHFFLYGCDASDLNQYRWRYTRIENVVQMMEYVSAQVTVNRLAASANSKGIADPKEFSYKFHVLYGFIPYKQKEHSRCETVSLPRLCTENVDI